MSQWNAQIKDQAQGPGSSAGQKICSSEDAPVVRKVEAVRVQARI